MNLQNKIKKLFETSNLSKPQIITNPNLPDMEIENDLCGKDLFELEKDTIRILSTDLTIFNNDAFRYYLPQFIYFCDISTEFVIEDMFIQTFFRSNLLNENTERFLQFKHNEKNIVVHFLDKIYNNICKITQTKQYKILSIWEQECILVPFKEYELEIKDAIKFWKNNNE
ncbi:hypothetical protein U5B43_10440 [Campylobacter sp. 9BO]|uniref:hypothetical protein n=1 Tax=Campylobacter sp. 9BO TaxID=3424759 RepID=UPI003D326D90